MLRCPLFVAMAWAAAVALGATAAWFWWDELTRRLVAESDEWSKALAPQQAIEEAEQQIRDDFMRGDSARNIA